MDINAFKAQLDPLIQSYQTMRGRSQWKDLSDLPKHERQSLITRSIAAINRISGISSVYSKELQRIIGLNPELHLHTSSVIGVVQALRDDLDAGYIKSLTEVVHAEVFSDFLDMATHLEENGYKDPAAVLAGSTLEGHLKKLGTKNGIDIIGPDGKFIKAERLNQDLHKATVYGLLDQKSITTWLDLRNKAAHGNYTEYTAGQVKLLISGVQDFIARTPA